MYTNKQRKSLFDKINLLSSTEHEEILKIVKNGSVAFSRNKNGVFFNLSTVPDELIKEIDNFVQYCMSNKNELDEYDKIINECKMCNNVKLPISNAPSTTLNTSLAHMGRMEPKAVIALGPHQPHQWSSLKVEDVSLEKFNKFLDRFHADKDKIAKKKINVKFNNAKKRFAKRSADKKIESDLLDNLVKDQALVSI
jgi:hypothetical protein